MTTINRCAAFVIAGCCAIIAASLGTELAARPIGEQGPRDGKAAYVFYGCANCHATTGHGGGRAGPSVSATKLDYETFLKQLRTPRTERMPPYRTSVMPDADVRLIYAFLKSST